MLGLEAVLPNGEIIRTGGKTVKNVVGYDVGAVAGGLGRDAGDHHGGHASARPEARGSGATLARNLSPSVTHAVRRAVVGRRSSASAWCRRRWSWWTRTSLNAVAAYARRATGAGRYRVRCSSSRSTVWPQAVARRGGAGRGLRCREAGRTRRAVRTRTTPSATQIWHVRRELSYALRADLRHSKINNDVVVPRGRVPELFALVERHRAGVAACRSACFGHAGDGNIHVNIMIDPAGRRARWTRGAARGRRSVRRRRGARRARSAASTASAFPRRRYLGLELSADVIALMKRVKPAFDPQWNSESRARSFPARRYKAAS